MKKSITSILPEKSGEVKSGSQSITAGPIRKLIRDHRDSDHSHGRATKHAIGVNHEPGLF
jgi:hypothetical protein